MKDKTMLSSSLRNNIHNNSNYSNMIIFVLMTYKTQLTSKFTDKADNLYFNSIGYVNKKYPANHFVHFIVIDERITISEYVDNLNNINKSHPVLPWIKSKSLKDDYMAYKIFQHGVIKPFHLINNAHYKNRQGLIKLRQFDLKEMFKNNKFVMDLIKNQKINLRIYGLVTDFKMISLIADNKKDVEFRKSNLISLS